MRTVVLINPYSFLNKQHTFKILDHIQYKNLYHKCYVHNEGCSNIY